MKNVKAIFINNILIHDFVHGYTWWQNHWLQIYYIYVHIRRKTYVITIDPWNSVTQIGVIYIYVRTYVFHMLRTYVMILCNWLILWQNTLYLYLGRLRMCLNTLRNHVSRSSVEAFKFVQEIKQRVQIH